MYGGQKQVCCSSGETKIGGILQNVKMLLLTQLLLLLCCRKSTKSFYIKQSVNHRMGGKLAHHESFIQKMGWQDEKRTLTSNACGLRGRIATQLLFGHWTARHESSGKVGGTEHMGEVLWHDS
jgi:hypothetical protein